jgi:hypothetical protein
LFGLGFGKWGAIAPFLLLKQKYPPTKSMGILHKHYEIKSTILKDILSVKNILFTYS